MAYVITEPCIGVKDTGCIDVWPMDCIHGTENDPMLYIDPAECIDCGGCVPACPANAIFPETEVPDKWKHYTQSNAEYFNSKK